MKKKLDLTKIEQIAEIVFFFFLGLMMMVMIAFFVWVMFLGGGR